LIETYSFKEIIDVQTLRSALAKFQEIEGSNSYGKDVREVNRRGRTYALETDDDWLAQYSKGFSTATYDVCRGPIIPSSLSILAVNFAGLKGTQIIISGISDTGMKPLIDVIVAGVTQSDACSVTDIFIDRYPKDQSLGRIELKSEIVREAPSPVIFIGHGRNQQWRELKDHLHDFHGYDVVSYETIVSAGFVTRDVLDDMLNRSSFGILVMTGEDLTGDGHLRPRQNVVHEVGLFQGRLGFSRAIVLEEESVETFSNLAGVQTIQFPPGRIRETYGDILATLRREFGSAR